MKLVEVVLCSLIVPLAACGSGKQGLNGAQGERGVAGPTGPAGETGPAGPTGAVGPQGPQGAIGPVGPVGADGPAGAMGIQGIQGLRGLTGLTGPVGPAGPAGPVGPQGVAGTDGVAGADGPVGPVGPAGPAGADGVSGGDSGCPGPRFEGVCVLDYANNGGGGGGQGLGGGGFFGESFQSAAMICASKGGDLCTDSQAYAITRGAFSHADYNPALINGPAWTASFADNDNYNWQVSNGGMDDDTWWEDQHGYSCCGGTTPADSRIVPANVNGVKVLAIHDKEDTYWGGAVRYCAMIHGDVCSDSQTALIRQSGLLLGRSWTSSHADNDNSLYAQINGGTSDDTYPSEAYGFACCASTTPGDLSCPVDRTLGVCATVIHDTADTNFMAAAQACASTGADVCSMAQTAVLRGAAVINGPMWTNSHSDNDVQDAEVAVGFDFPDDPDLFENFGYACCLR